MRYIERRDPDFPALLGHIPDPPPGIYVRGVIPEDGLHRIAVIGARACSEYGMSAAALFARELAQNGVVVVSGMARGIDAAAHRAAIEGGGKTIAVLGGGVDVCYPPEHDGLMEAIIQNGCVVSEYPAGTKPAPYHFPERNRIISGLCNGVVIVEAAEKSGTTATVNHALEQGRDVFAVPGSVFNRLSRGTNELIKQGAIPVTCAADILHELKSPTWHKANLRNHEKQENHEKKQKINLAPNEVLVYDCLGSDSVHIDKIVYDSGLSNPEVQYILTKLELTGRVKRLPGNSFSIVHC